MKKYYLGIDVSKNDLTYCLAKDQNETVMTGEIDNDSKTISTFLKNVLKKNNISKEQLVVGAEYTGIYSNLLASVCATEGYKLWLEDPAKMKNGFYEKREKTDKLDARRIAEYIWRYSDKTRLYVPRQETIQLLKDLLRTLASLRKDLATYEMQLGEEKKFSPAKSYAARTEILAQVNEALKNAIMDTEKRIAEAISSDPGLNEIDMRIRSIPGVGPVTSHVMICVTEGFTKFDDSRPFLRYSGMAPQLYDSGTSVHKRPKTSKACCHLIKQTLYMPSLAFCSNGGKRGKEDTELLDFYKRKKEGQGKHHCNVQNVIMAKIVRRIFAVVKEGREYLPTDEYNRTYHPERMKRTEGDK